MEFDIWKDERGRLIIFSLDNNAPKDGLTYIGVGRIAITIRGVPESGGQEEITASGDVY